MPKLFYAYTMLTTAFVLSYKAARMFFSRASSTLFSRISIAEFYFKIRDKGSNFVLVTVCGERRAAKFDFEMEKEIAPWRRRQMERWLSPRTRGWGPGRTVKDSERQHNVWGNLDVGRGLSLPHRSPCIPVARP